MTITVAPIWVDCDPGHDDALALLMACFMPEYHLLGVSTSYGNSNSENTNYNARSLLTAWGYENKIPILKGMHKPWVVKPSYAQDVHGESGLDGTTLLPKPKVESNKKISYLDAIERAINDNINEISIIVTGPLTNIASLFKDRPQLKNRVKWISIMGAAFDGIGNKNKNMSAEFNFYADPHAAKFVMQDPILKKKCILCPLNLTHQLIATSDIQEKLGANDGSKLRRLFYELFQYFAKVYAENQNFSQGPPVHDPVTLFVLLDKLELEATDVLHLIYKRFDINVITNLDSDDLGKSVVTSEYDHLSDNGILVAYNINCNYFWDRVLHTLSIAELHSTIDA